MNRGYEVLYDSMDFADLLSMYIKPGSSEPDIDEEEFLNMVNDFYFHNICATAISVSVRTRRARNPGRGLWIICMTSILLPWISRSVRCWGKAERKEYTE